MSSSLVGAVFGGGTIVVAVKYNTGFRISHSYRSALEECNIEPLAYRRATKCKTFIRNIQQGNPLSNQVKSRLELRTKPYNLRATTDTSPNSRTLTGSDNCCLANSLDNYCKCYAIIVFNIVIKCAYTTCN